MTEVGKVTKSWDHIDTPVQGGRSQFVPEVGKVTKSWDHIDTPVQGVRSQFVTDFTVFIHKQDGRTLLISYSRKFGLLVLQIC